MNCSKCNFYEAFFYIDEPCNVCKLLGISNFKEQINCVFINEDGSINQDELDKSPL